MNNEKITFESVEIEVIVFEDETVLMFGNTSYVPV